MKLSASSRLAIPLLIGSAISIALLVFSETSHRQLNAANEALAQAMETQAAAVELLTLVTDAETAERGFLLTENRTFLEPYLAAAPKIAGKLDALAALVAGDAEQKARVAQLRTLIATRFEQLDDILSLFRDQGSQAARAKLQANGALTTMDEIRREIDAMIGGERAAVVQLSYRWIQDVANYRSGLAVATALNVILLAVVYVLAARELVRRERMRERLLEQKHLLEDQVRDRTAELSALSSELQRLQEIEKSDLARELHDEMGSILVSAKMDVSWAVSRIRELHPQAAEKLKRALMTLDDGVEIKRRIIDDLRPALLDNLGLGAAISWHVEQMSERSGLLCTVVVPEDDSPLPGHVAIALFRVVQEALTNIVRHAKAKKARVELQCTEEEVRLEIVDDGEGLPPALRAGAPAHGIMSMRQRMLGVRGEFEMRSSRGSGTTIRVRAPLEAPQKNSNQAGTKI